MLHAISIYLYPDELVDWVTADVEGEVVTILNTDLENLMHAANTAAKTVAGRLLQTVRFDIRPDPDQKYPGFDRILQDFIWQSKMRMRFRAVLLDPDSVRKSSWHPAMLAVLPCWSNNRPKEELLQCKLRELHDFLSVLRYFAGSGLQCGFDLGPELAPEPNDGEYFV